jgi:predicted DNA-binding WGR domain protein
MRTFFYFGRNPQNKSGVSWKLWKIERQGRTVSFAWAPAVIRKRRVVPAGALQLRKTKFRSVSAAVEHFKRRIREQLRKGYEPAVRRVR